MKVSVIIVTYNGKRYLENCLNSVFDQTMPRSEYEVIVIDNNSTDGTMEFVQSSYPDVRAKKLEKNYGYYGAFNYGASCIALGEYLMALPQDTILHRKCLLELVRVLETDPAIKLCLVNSVYPTYPDFEKKEMDAWIDWVYLFETTRLGYTYPRRWAFFERPVPILAYSGVSAMIKVDRLRDDSEDLFDADLSHFLGDVDLGVRYNIWGYRAMLVPTAIVYHIEDNKTWLEFKLLFRSLEGARDTVIVYYKNMYSLEFLFYLPFLVIGTPFKTFALRFSLFKRLILFIIACVMTPLVFLWAFLLFGKFSEKRRQVLAKRKSGHFWLAIKILKGDFTN